MNLLPTFPIHSVHGGPKLMILAIHAIECYCNNFAIADSVIGIVIFELENPSNPAVLTDRPLDLSSDLHCTIRDGFHNIRKCALPAPECPPQWVMYAIGHCPTRHIASHNQRNFVITSKIKDCFRLGSPRVPAPKLGLKERQAWPLFRFQLEVSHRISLS